MLGARESGDRIVALHEYLDWGPINLTFEERVRWLADHSALEDGWDWLVETVEQSEADIAAADGDRIIWIAPRSACEQAGLSWFLHHFGGGKASMVVADFPPGEAWRGEAPLSLGELGTEQLAIVLDARPPQPLDEARFPRTRWSELVAEAALLRIVQDGTLQSAPAEFFDPVILQCCPADWTRWYRVVGQAMADAMNAGHRVDDSFLHWRLTALAQSGRLEIEGDLANRGKPEEAARVRRISTTA